MSESRNGLARRALLRGALGLGALAAFAGGLAALDVGHRFGLQSRTTALPTGTPIPSETTSVPPSVAAVPMPTADAVVTESAHVPPPTATVPASSATPDRATPVATDVARNPAPATTTRLRQPNVLLITIDTLRADRLGAYGFKAANTPTLDRLAREGVRFDRAICQLPQTNASHAALLTGLYPSTSGVKVHMVDKLRPNSQTIASLFLDSGYRTAGIYSWVSLDPQFCGLNQGFQTYDGYVLNRSLLFSDPHLEALAALYRQFKARLPIVKTVDVALNSSDSIEKSLDGRADVTNAAVFQWLETHGHSDPFMLWVHYFDPHYPYTPPAGYDHVLGLKYSGKVDGSIDTLDAIEHGKLTLTDADRGRLEELYQGEIAFVDAQLGLLISELARRGILDDTIIVLTGDHGESFGEHDDWTHGLRVYESEIHVPLLIRYPRQLPPGVSVASPVQLIDVFPTLLGLTGLRAAKPLQGSSLIPLIKGTSDKTAPLAFTELADESFVSLLTADWKLIRNNANGELQLYRLSDDESELRNLARDQPTVTRELTARLQDLMKISGISH